MRITDNMHGTHEQFRGVRPDGLTVVAVNSGYRAFDIYNVAKFAHEVKKSNIDRNDLWLQIKDRALYETGRSHTKTELEYFNACLSLLNTDYIDSYLTTLPMRYDPNISNNILKEDALDKWRSLESIYRLEKLNYIGVEHIYSLDNLKILVSNASIKPSFVHNQGFEIEWLNYCLENAIVFQFFGAMQHGPEAATIAQNHNVTARQVELKFYTQLGMQVLKGGNQAHHVKENANVDFELTSDEMKQLIAPLEEKEQLLSIYEQLQDQTLMTLSNIITNISNCAIAELPNLMTKIGHYVAKLDPTSLAEIMTAQDPIIIDYLQQYNANFAEITSSSYTKMIASHDLSFIDILREKLQTQPEKLLVASLNANDSSYFDKLIKISDLNKLPKNDIEKIIKFYPAIVEDFISANINPENLLVATSFLTDKQIFADLLNKADLTKLTNIDLVKIIHNLGSKSIVQLHNKGVDFSILTTIDIESLAEEIEIIKALAEVNPSADLLLPALKLGTIELFDELITKVDLSNFSTYHQVKEILDNYPEALDQLIQFAIPDHTLIMASLATTLEKDISIYEEIISKLSLDKMESYDISAILFKSITTGNSELINIAATKLDLSKISSWDIFPILHKVHAIIDSTLFDFIISELDFSNLSYYSKYTALWAIDIRSYELLDAVIDNLDSPEIQEVLFKTKSTGDSKLFEIVFNKLDSIKIHSWNIKAILFQAIDNGDHQLLNDLLGKLDLSEMYEYEINETLSKARDAEDAKMIDVLVEGLSMLNLGREIDLLLKEYAIVNSEQQKESLSESSDTINKEDDIINQCLDEGLPYYEEKQEYAGQTTYNDSAYDH